MLRPLPAALALLTTIAGCSSDDGAAPAPDCWGSCCQSTAPADLRAICADASRSNNRPIAYACKGTPQPGYEPAAAMGGEPAPCVAAASDSGSGMCCAQPLTAPIK